MFIEVVLFIFESSEVQIERGKPARVEDIYLSGGSIPITYSQGNYIIWGG
jgi:hypothetical protein